MVRFRPLIVLTCLTTLWQTGCGPTEQVKSYSVDKPHRFFAAIIPHQEKCWLFRLSGTSAELKQQESVFREFVQSVHFPVDDSGPSWKLPKDWKTDIADRGSFDLRHATLRLGPEQQPFELSVTQWEVAAQGTDEFILKRVNRWRRQMSMPTVDQQYLQERRVNLSGAGLQATVIDLLGTLSPEKMTFDVPDQWASSAGNAFSVVAFAVRDRPQQGELTISTLGRGSIPANVNRWRRQVGLPPTDASRRADTSRQVRVDDVMGTYVVLVGRQSTILGVIVVRGEKMWFVKWMGDVELSELQKKPFEAFVQSIEFVP